LPFLIGPFSFLVTPSTKYAQMEGEARDESGRGGGGGGMSLVSVDPGVLMVLPKDFVCATCQATRRLLQDRDREDAEGGRGKKVRRAGKNAGKKNRHGPRACSHASSSPFQTPTPYDSGDEKERDRDRRLDILSGGGGGGGAGVGAAGAMRGAGPSPHSPPIGVNSQKNSTVTLRGNCTRILTF
jgi:hypothetical protein